MKIPEYVTSNLTIEKIKWIATTIMTTITMTILTLEYISIKKGEKNDKKQRNNKHKSTKKQ